jgi:hypothetical protein
MADLLTERNMVLLEVCVDYGNLGSVEGQFKDLLFDGKKE